MSDCPNIVYLHAHDAGRWVQPYGKPVDTPHLMRFAQEAVLYRNAFAVSPTCGPSRAALLTGEYPHQVGMLGLPGKRGWLIDDYNKHLVQQLNCWGYETVLAGVQHEANHEDFSCIGYSRVLESEVPARPQAGEFYPETIDKVERFLATREKGKPFFLSIGIDEPHRDNIPRPELGLEGDSKRFTKTRYYDPNRLDARYGSTPPWLPDLPEIRQDMESYRHGVHIMDEYMGRVFDALSHSGWNEDTWVIVTTDHGIEFPGGKKTLRDQGLEVMLMIRGPENSNFPRGVVIEPLVTQLDIWPTLCDILKKATPDRLEGKSLLPLTLGQENALHSYIFGEQTEHDELEPLRCVRTERFKYVVRYFDKGPSLRHDGPTCSVVEKHGWYDRSLGGEELFDLYLDPMEACNRVEDPAYGDIVAELRKELVAWMHRTNDVFPSGEFPRPPSD